MGWKKKIERARRLHRPSLKDWECDGLYEIFPAYVKSVLEEEQYQSLRTNGRPMAAHKSIPVLLDAKNTSQKQFAEDYEAKCIPAVITNIPNGHDLSQHESKDGRWSAVQNWQLDTLKSDSHLRNRFFKCGEDDDGKSVKV